MSKKVYVKPYPKEFREQVPPHTSSARRDSLFFAGDRRYQSDFARRSHLTYDRILYFRGKRSSEHVKG